MSVNKRIVELLREYDDEVDKRFSNFNDECDE
jgi:hypothetical protein